jgi:hypothetical protein
MRSASLLVLSLTVAACGAEVGGTNAGGGADTAAGVSFSPVAADNDSDADANVGAGANDDAGDDDDDASNEGADAGNDGADAGDDTDDTGDDVVVPPAEQAQSCTEWQECGPNGGDLNSGFDCDNGQCACNVAGGYDDACRDIGGYWSDAECFCFVTSSRPPESNSNDDDDAYCWWSWFEECEPDEWIDTSYYRRVCDSQGCRDVYTRRGYWRSGHCEDIWVHECDDGTYQEYR